MQKITKRWSALVALFALLLTLLPGMAQAAVTWTNVGGSLWLNAGSGLDLATGGAGEDLVLTGTKVTSKGGMAVVPGATGLSSLLTPPSSGYTTSLDASAVEYKVLVIKLADGRYAQVAVGMGWRSGMGFSSLEIVGWSVSTAAESKPAPKPDPQPEPQPDPKPLPEPDPEPTPDPKPDPKPEPQPGPDEAISAGSIFWDAYTQKGQLTLGRGLNLETGGAGNDLQMTSTKVTAPHGLVLMERGIDLSLDLATVTFTNAVSIKEAEEKSLLVKLGNGRYAWVTVGTGWRGGGGYSGLDLYWSLGVPMGLPESQLASRPYQPAKAPGTDRLIAITPDLPGPIPSRTAVWTGTYAYVWTKDGVYRLDPATNTLTGLAVRLNGASGLDAAASVWTGTYAYTIYSTTESEAYIVQYDPTNNRAEIKGAELPNAYYSAAVWDGTYMYIFGVRDEEKGDYDSDRNRLILRYDPATDSLKTLKATLPAMTGYDTPFLSAAWDGEYAYLFGFDSGAVLRYDPATDTLKQMRALVPGKLSGASAFYDGRNIYLMGGQKDGWEATSGILRYDPTADRISTMSSTLPNAHMNGAVVWVGDGAYLFGGWDWTTGHRQILRYSTGNVDQSLVPEQKPADATVAELTAIRKNGKAVITWPAFATPNDGYYVFRGTAPGKYDPAPLHDFPVLTGSFTDEEIAQGMAYYYVVKAYKDGQYVDVSAEVRLADEEAKAEPKPETPDKPEKPGTPTEPENPTEPAEPLACDLGAAVGEPKVLKLAFTPGSFYLRADCTAWIHEEHSTDLFRIDLKSGTTKATITLPTSLSRMTAYTADPDLLYWVNESGPVHMYNGATGSLISKVDLPRIQWWDIPTPIGAVVDPATGRLIVYQTDAFWVVEPSGKATGPYRADAGPGGVTAAAVQGHTLWLLGLPTADSPVVAVPVDLQNLTVGAPVTLLETGAADFSLGVTFAVHPDGRTFYVGAQAKSGAFVALVRGGKVLRRTTLPDFRLTPQLTLSPDGNLLVLRDTGSASAGDGRSFSVQGALSLAQASDLAILATSGGKGKQGGNVFETEAGKPVFAVFSPDNRLLFVGDTTVQTITIHRFR